MAQPETELPRNIKWELARVAQYKPVCADSVTYTVDAQGCALISFDIDTDQLADAPPSADIKDTEAIRLRYLAPEYVGRFAPSVLSAREDFPRDLQHINPGPDEEPVSICLARTGLQAIYDAFGVFGVLLRLSDWLNDAKIGNLDADGWDPTPMLQLEDCVLGYLDAKALQEHAAAHPDGGHAFLAAQLTHNNNGNVFIQAGMPILDTSDQELMQALRLQMKSFNSSGVPFHSTVPAIFVWPETSVIDTIPRYNRWRDIQSLKAGLADAGLWSHAETASLMFDPLFKQDQFDTTDPDMDKAGNGAFVLITGLWRPTQLDPTIVGLSDNAIARRLELRAFYLERPADEKDRWSDATRLRDFYGLVPATPEILEAVSGEKALPALAIIGFGALGSALADYAVRGGANQLTVIDNDTLLSHNIARHRGRLVEVRHNKAQVASAISQSIAQDVEVKTETLDFLILNDEDREAALQGRELIIDATANAQVRSQLSIPKASNAVLMRTEIFDRGRLGVTMLTRRDSPHTLNMLYRQLVATAQTDKSVAAWLKYEASRSFAEEELILGFGCRSLTTKMPAYKIDAHAAAAFAFGRSRLDDLPTPKIALHELDEQGLSLGVRIIEPGGVVAFEGRDAQSRWRIVVTESAIEDLHRQRLAKAPIETGGYLYGAIDEAAREIAIVWASPEPPGTTASATHLDLGPQGLTGEEKAFLRRTSGRLPPIGTWHAHPAGAPVDSAKDRATLNRFKHEDAARGLPTVMVITGVEADEAYVVEA